jgi:hypothetical protein
MVSKVAELVSMKSGGASGLPCVRVWVSTGPTRSTTFDCTRREINCASGNLLDFFFLRVVGSDIYFKNRVHARKMVGFFLHA